MHKIKLLIIIIVAIIVLALSGLCAHFYFEARELESKIKIEAKSEKVLYFADIFVEKVILASGTVSFNDRLMLENAVRDINDSEIFDQWQKITDSKTDEESQENVGNLLRLLISRISGKK